MQHGENPLIDPRRWNWSRRSILFSTTGVLFVFLGLAAFTDVKLSQNPQLCISCHQNKPLYEEWKTSTHKGISCIQCHTEPGVGGIAKIYASTVKNVIIQTVGREGPIEANVSNSSCLRCHSKDKQPEVLEQSALRIAHSRHESQQCVDCHKTLVHTRQLESPLKVQDTEEQAKSRCQVCHKPSDTFVHGPSDVACTSCHSANIPNHDLAQKKTALPKTGCIECHTKQQVSTPEGCQKCHISPHGIEQACQECHTSVTTWTERSFTHPIKLVGNHAPLKCEQCHTNGKDFKGLTYACANCHQPKHEVRADNNCALCHTPLGFRVFGATGEG